MSKKFSLFAILLLTVAMHGWCEDGKKTAFFEITAPTFGLTNVPFEITITAKSENGLPRSSFTGKVKKIILVKIIN